MDMVDSALWVLVKVVEKGCQSSCLFGIACASVQADPFWNVEIE
jgi:hypothetical protein